MAGLLGALFDPQFQQDVKRGLLDAANRGVIGGLLGGPVDLATMAMRPFGYNVEKPVGGSEWIGDKLQQAGIVSGNRNPLAEALASIALPSAAPAVGRAVYKAEQALAPTAQEMARKALEAHMVRAGMIQPATVWHGSPHKFSKFDSSKIGTGEGAQAYGHGLYLAESPDVAKSYQTALAADRGFSYGGKSGLTRTEVQDMVNAKYGAGYLDGVLRPSGVADSFIDDMVTGLNRSEGAYPRQYKAGSQRAKLYDELRGQITHADPGSLYKVDLPDEAIAKMLDWDKPLSQQAPEVQKAISQIKSELTGPFSQDMTGDQLLRHIQSTLKGVGRGSEKAEALLGQKGIPGIRYLDQGSRGSGAGTSNFVVFPGNEGLLTILERNGLPIVP